MSILLGLLVTGCAGSTIAGGALMNEYFAEGETGTRLALRIRPRLRGALGPGRVGKLVGAIVSCPGAPLVAPITQTECVAYEVSARVRWQKRHDVRRTMSSLVEVRARDFVLRDDATGARLMVRASRGARAFLAKSRVVRTGLLEGPRTRAMNEFVARHDDRFNSGLVGRDQASIYEGLLAVGDRVAVIGGIVFDPGFDGAPTDEAVSGYRTAVEKLGVGPLPRGWPLLLGNEPGALR